MEGPELDVSVSLRLVTPPIPTCAPIIKISELAPPNLQPLTACLSRINSFNNDR